ncbi:hypothetical protein AALO_G00304230 [Alosa alosa]|uniref:Uncharacterized protein n=1 Tax=Alosa alosa TaxID=278164 RepID=A0AAV6FFE9_9TELE|nr:hypothetical protein AALO_G00304230 [Alosa alosa]
MCPAPGPALTFAPEKYAVRCALEPVACGSLTWHYSPCTFRIPSEADAAQSPILLLRFLSGCQIGMRRIP